MSTKHFGPVYFRNAEYGEQRNIVRNNSAVRKPAPAPIANVTVERIVVDLFQFTLLVAQLRTHGPGRSGRHHRLAISAVISLSVAQPTCRP